MDRSQRDARADRGLAGALFGLEGESYLREPDGVQGAELASFSRAVRLAAAWGGAPAHSGTASMNGPPCDQIAACSRLARSISPQVARKIGWLTRRGTRPVLSNRSASMWIVGLVGAVATWMRASTRASKAGTWDNQPMGQGTETPQKLAIACDCVSNCTVLLVAETWDDHPDGSFALDFYTRVEQQHQMRDRFRIAWQVLRGHAPYIHGLVLYVDTARQLRDFLNERVPS